MFFLFSFNNPTGACQNCDGLGVKQFFDPSRVIVNSGLSLAGGAIRAGMPLGVSVTVRNIIMYE